MAKGKSSAVAAIAANMGNSEAHTSDPAEAAAADLFATELADLFGISAVRPPRGPGRPPGPTRTTMQLQRLLAARGYRDPAEFLAALFTMDTRDLARSIGSEDPDVTLRVQVQAARALMPYFHAKMPVAVQHVGAEGRPVIVINDGPSAVRVGRIDDALSIHDIEENQGPGGSPAGQSHGEGSHDE